MDNQNYCNFTNAPQPPLKLRGGNGGVMIHYPAHRLLSALFAICLGLLSPTLVHAGEEPITPYGGYCKDCAVYGSCRESIPPKEAIQSLRKYYEERGYRLGNIAHKGRFIEAEVLQNNKQVDTVIFDRKTGRMRSTY
jgi:hypothetical protein